MWGLSINSAPVVTISGQQLFTKNSNLSLEISLDRESVYALDTIFTISAIGWVLPLRYEFGHIDGDVFSIVQGSEQLFCYLFFTCWRCVNQE
jgi:hypothetical protein